MAGFGAAKKRLSKKMAAVPKEVRKALRAQNRANAEELVQTIKGFIDDKSGALGSSIKRKDVSNSKRISQRITAGGSTTTKPVRKMKNGASPTYDYALANEFGTENMPAQPFFWPAWRLKRRRFKTRMSREAKKAIKAATA